MSNSMLQEASPASLSLSTASVTGLDSGPRWFRLHLTTTSLHTQAEERGGADAADDWSPLQVLHD